MTNSRTSVYNYHDATKHHFNRYAKSLGYMDWDRQPDPYRRYEGAAQIALAKIPDAEQPAYDDVFEAGKIESVPLSHAAISQLFFDSMALSALVRYGAQDVAKRVNPSSGNLHPTEAYLLCGAIKGVTETPMICHYSPKHHALEKRAELPAELWEQLTKDLPAGTILVGLSSIYWRESWKYGERAFRYCNHDVGHALGAITIAAAGLGWQTRLIDDLGAEEMRLLMGLPAEHGPESEHPDCLVAIFPRTETTSASIPTSTSVSAPQLHTDSITAFATLDWQGEPNVLSPSHVPWPIIDHVAAATGKPMTAIGYQSKPAPSTASQLVAKREHSLRHIVRTRRSAYEMDGVTQMSRENFYHILSRTLSMAGNVPFDVLPWEPLVHVVVFVHRVDDMEPGVYMLVRNPEQKENLRAATRAEFLWERASGCPVGLDLYLLTKTDARQLAKAYSCDQNIAADSCFSLGMITEFERPLTEYGAWFYPRLYWETGLIGQMLYLEAEAIDGLRGTGIGCFMDDPVHKLLGLSDKTYQDLYHFTVGGPLEDTRIVDLPPYQE